MATVQEIKPLVFYASPGSLQRIVASKIALICWRHRLENFNRDERNDKFYQVSIHDYSLPLPRQLIDLINQFIKPLSFKFENWWDFHSILYFDLDARSHLEDSIRTDCINSIICKTNGTADICYERTAEYLLINDKLSPLQKYRLACMYRFNGYVEKLWPLVTNPSEIEPKHIIDVPFWDKEFKYWKYSERNYYKIDTMTLPNSINRWDLRHSMKILLAYDNNMYPKMKVEYFCNFLQSQEEIEDVIFVLLFGNSARVRDCSIPHCRFKLDHYEVTKYLLPKLNIEPLKRILKRYPILIITHLAHDEENYGYILEIWNHMKDLIDQFTFFTMLYKLWQMAYFCRFAPFNRHVASLLCDLFMGASDDLRNYVVDHVEKFFDDLPDYRGENDLIKYGSNVEFLFQLLKNIKIELRNQLWGRNWYKLILLMDASNLDRLIKLCCKDEDEIMRCKRDLRQNCSTSKPFVYNVFVDNGFIIELITFLRFIIPSDDEIAKKMKLIINSNMNRMIAMDFNVLRRFSILIDDMFESTCSAKSFKEDYITKNVDFWCDCLRRGYLIKVKNMIDCLISSKRCKIHLKSVFYGYYHNVLRFGNFKIFIAYECDEFLHWCAPSQMDMNTYKESLNIGDIFHRFVAELKALAIENKPQRPFFIFHKRKYTDFLQWYFVYDNFRKDFVDNMFDNLHEDDHVKSMLRLHFY